MKNIGRKNTQLILSGNIPKALLSLAIPIVINNFIQTMYNLTDTFWLGKLGTSEMAAISLVSPLQNIIVNFGQGITIAGPTLDYGISLGNRGSGFGNDVCKSSLWNNCCAFSF